MQKPNSTLKKEYITIQTKGIVAPIAPNGYGCWSWVATVSPMVDKAQEQCRTIYERGYGYIGTNLDLRLDIVEFRVLVEVLHHISTQRTSWQGVKVYCSSAEVVGLVYSKWYDGDWRIKPYREEVKRLLEVTACDLQLVNPDQIRQARELAGSVYQLARTGRIAPQALPDYWKRKVDSTMLSGESKSYLYKVLF